MRGCFFGAFMIVFFDSLNKILWGVPVLLLILSVGLFYSLKTSFVQLRLLPASIRQMLSSFRAKNAHKEGVSAYRALCTALAATVGTGNLAGVAGAIAIGGPGAVFWIWVSGMLGMVIKLGEVILAIHYRVKNNAEEWVGGPMYTIINAMPRKYHALAYIYSFFGVVAAFGVGNTTQVNAVVDGVQRTLQSFGCPVTMVGSLLIGMVLAVFLLFSFRKGAGKIGEVTEMLVPLAAGVYILLSLGVLIVHFDKLPKVIGNIIVGAFRPKAVTGGMIGSAFQTMRIGISRGIFTNEAGMGTASIAHAASNTDESVSQGLLGIAEVFLDTILICTLTAFVILCSNTPITFGLDSGIQLTFDAFSSVYGTWIQLPLTIIVCLLAVATVLGWGLYGVRCAQFLLGDAAWNHYVICQTVGVIVGSVMNTSLVWTLSEILNGLMAIPNLIALIYLSSEFTTIVKGYRSK